LEQVEEFLRSSDEDVRGSFEEGLEFVLNVASSGTDAERGTNPERTPESNCESLRLGRLVDRRGDDDGLNASRSGRLRFEGNLLSEEGGLGEDELESRNDVGLDPFLNRGSLSDDVLTSNDARDRFTLDLGRRSKSTCIEVTAASVA
jgi:hypothetical protein